MNEETIETIIFKHKLYMSMDSYEYEAITKVDLYKLIEEIERLHSIIKEAKDFINGKDLKENEYRFAEDFNFTKLLEILDKVD